MVHRIEGSAAENSASDTCSAHKESAITCPEC